MLSIVTIGFDKAGERSIPTIEFDCVEKIELLLPLKAI
jgi:hypothetical protein